MSDAPPEGADLREWLERRQNSRIHLRIAAAALSLGVFGGCVLGWVMMSTGLQVGRHMGILDLLNIAFMGCWMMSLVRFGTWDGKYYQARFFGRVQRTKYFDILIPTMHAVSAIL